MKPPQHTILVTYQFECLCYRDLKNFIGDRSSNVSRKDTVQRCSRGLNGLKNIRRHFGEDEDSTGGPHRRPEDIRHDIRLAVESLKADLFEDLDRSSHPLAKKQPIFLTMTPRSQKNFAKYVQEITGVAVIHTALQPSSEDCLQELQ